MSEDHGEMRSDQRRYSIADSAVMVSEASRPRWPSQTFRKTVPAYAGMAKWSDMALLAFFSLAICLPLLGLVLRLDAGYSLEENRVLSTRPELTPDRSKLAEFPAKFEAYFNDQFGFRKRLIYWLNFTKVAALGVSPNPKVIFGRNGWMFYGDTDIPYFRALTPLSPAQLLAWQERLEEESKSCQRPAAFPYPGRVVRALKSATIYPEN